MSSSDDKTPTYPGGMDAVLAQMDGRLDPLDFAEGEALPELTCDLGELTRAVVPPADEDPLRAIKPVSGNHRKTLELRAELAGHSELAVLHGLLVAHLRKRSQPSHTFALFERLWAEQSEHLLEQLNPRWQVSAITTFGDHGRTHVQRTVGSALSVLFGMMKLYESERRYSGHGAQEAYTLVGRSDASLPMEMDAYAITGGGLDVNMLGRLWKDAEKDDVMQPLAHGLLDALIHDPATIFRRLRIMRGRLERRRALREMRATPEASKSVPTNVAPVSFVPPRRSDGLTWGVVCTTNAPLPRIQEWAAHYITLGATQLHIYIDKADKAVTAALSDHPAITLITCDAAYWKDTGKARPKAHQLRQAHNATRALRNCGLHLLAHFDIDEFLISPGPLKRSLSFIDPDAASARVRPVELLSPLDDGGPRHFKRAQKHVGVPKSALEDLFPNFGPYLPGGFVSHTSGKVFARTGIPDTRLGIHTLKYKGESVSNQAELPRMALAHVHTDSFEHFRDRVTFRLESGSYRKPEGKDDMALFDVLDYLKRDEGDAGLRAFYDEVCTARPELLKSLDAHGMLMTHDLDLPAKVARVFGESRAAGAA